MFAARNPQKTCFSLVENVLLVSDFNQNRFDRFIFEGIGWGYLHTGAPSTYF